MVFPTLASQAPGLSLRIAQTVRKNRHTSKAFFDNVPGQTKYFRAARK
jgi:hypothetical protein